MKTTVESRSRVEGAAPPRWVLASGLGALRVHPLPESGLLTIGRGADCDLVLDHVKVSRHHIRLRIGPVCTITDLGSRNGTVFRGVRLATDEERPVGLGESFSAGPFSLLLVQGDAAMPPAPGGGASLLVEDPAITVPSPLLTALGRSPVSVLIRGETGVGKEVLARSLHRLSGRSGPLLGVNCAALTETLLENELFGNEKGAFTGATGKPGLLEAAAGGTVFLDEVADMAPALQAKILRAIEAREVLRVGGVRPVAIDVRFVAATHGDLLGSTTFRRDLFYRLAGITLEIPPLRARRGRIATLAVELLAQVATIAGQSSPPISKAALARLGAHGWPGNVRELRNVVERALLLSGGGELRPEHILFDEAAHAPAAPPAPTAAPGDDDERARILAALDSCAGNQTRAAKMLGISRATLVNKISSLQIPRPRKR